MGTADFILFKSLVIFFKPGIDELFKGGFFFGFGRELRSTWGQMKSRENTAKQPTCPSHVDINPVTISLEIPSSPRLLMTRASERRRILFIAVLHPHFFLYSTNEAFQRCWRKEILILHVKPVAGLRSCRSKHLVDHLLAVSSKVCLFAGSNHQNIPAL